jgi:hypothetical protein
VELISPTWSVSAAGSFSASSNARVNAPFCFAAATYVPTSASGDLAEAALATVTGSTGVLGPAQPPAVADAGVGRLPTCRAAEVVSLRQGQA